MPSQTGKFSVEELLHKNAELESRLAFAENLLTQKHAFGPDSAFATDAAGNLLNVSQAFQTLTGLRINADIFTLIHPDDATAYLTAWTSALKTGEAFSQECRIKLLNGQYRWFLAKALPLRSDDLSILQWLANFTDIHDLKVAAAHAGASQSRLDLAFQALAGNIFDWDLQSGKLLYVSNLENLLGYSFEQLSSDLSAFQALIHPEDLANSTFNRIHTLPRDQKILESKYRILHARNEWISVCERCNIVRNSVGTPVRMVSLVSDITESLRIEEALRKSNEKLRFQADILASTNDAVIALDSDQKIIYLNAGAERLYKTRLADCLGLPLTDLREHIWENPEDEKRALHEVMTSGSWQGEGTQILRDGTRIEISATVNVQHAEFGGGLVAIIRDVSDRRRAEKEIERHVGELARANDDLLHFAYAVSHDLQAPLRTIITFSQILARQFEVELGPETLKLISSIVNAGTRMTSMISDLLEFAKVAGNEQHAYTKTSMQNALATALESLKGSIIEAGAEIACDSLPTVICDTSELSRIFENLIGNALKYRSPQEPCRIQITASRQNDEWIISVADNGIGFEQQFADKIFGVFQRLHNTGFSGTGIGLAICKRLVERQGGRIWAEGAIGKGATFYFTIPDRELQVPSVPRSAPVSKPVPVALKLEPPPQLNRYLDEVFHALDLAQAVVRTLDERIEVWTKGSESLFGFTNAEALGKNMLDLVHKEFPIPASEIQAILLAKGEWAGQVKAVRKDGTPLWLASHFSLYRDGSGRPQSVVEVHNGINALKQAEEALRTSAEQRDLALRAGQMGIWRWNFSTDYVEWTENRESASAFTPLVFKGNADAFLDLVHSDDRIRVQTHIAEAFKNRSDYRVDFRLIRSDGSYGWFRCRGKATYDRDNAEQKPWATGLIGVVWEVTEQKHSELDQQFLLDVSTALAGGSQPEQLVALAMNALGSYLVASRCRYDESNSDEGTSYRFPDYKADGKVFTPPSGPEFFTRVHPDTQNGLVIQISDTQSHDLTKEEYESSYLPAAIRSVLCLPIHREGVYRARIFVAKSHPHVWTSRETNLVRAVAERLWPALESSRLLLLTKSQQKEFEQTFHLASVGLAHVAEDGRWLRVNERVCEITGYSREELLKMNFQQITHPEDLDSDLELYAALKQGDIPSYSLEKRYFRKDGSIVWIHLSTSIVRDDSGCYSYTISVISDIADRKKAEEELAVSIELAAAHLNEIEVLYATAPIGLSLSDRDFRLLRINQRLAEMNGVPVEETIGRKVFDALPLMARNLEPLLREVLETGTPIVDREITCKSLGHPNVVRTFLVSCYAQFNAQGMTTGVNSVVQDFTDRKETELAWLDAADRLRLATSAARLGVVTYEYATQQAIWENQQVYTLFKRDRSLGPLSPEDFFHRVVHPEDSADAIKAYQHQLEHDDEFHLKCRVFRGDGALRWIEFSGQFERDPKGNAIRLLSVVADITELADADRLLKQQRQHLQDVLNSLVVFVGVLSPDGRLLEINRAPLEASGLTADDVIGKQFHETYWWSWSHIVQSRIHDAIERAQQGESSRFDVQLRGSRGRMISVDFSLTPMRDAEGRISYLIPSAVPIEERKQMEIALRTSESRSRLMLDAMDQLAWIADHDGSRSWYNRQWYEYTGSSPEQMKGFGWQSVQHPDTLPQITANWKEGVKKGQPFDFRYPIRGADGIYRIFLTRVIPLHDSEGLIREWFGTNTDVQVLLREQDRLLESERKFRELAETLPLLIWEADSAGNLLYWNPQYYAYAGVPPGQLDHDWASIIHPDDSAQLLENWSQSLENMKPFRSEARLRRNDGQYRWFSNRAEPFKNEKGELLKWIGTSIEIHDQKLAEQALRRSNADLQQFAYAASHDLREPLRNVAIYTQLVDQQYRGSGELASRYVDYIVNGIQRMDLLLKGLIEYARTSTPPESNLSVDPNPVIQSLLDEMKAPLEQVSANVNLSDLPSVACSPMNIRFIFHQLLENSIKFASDNPLTLSISGILIEEFVQFTFKDNGIGIAPEFTEHIFGMFKRLHKDEYPGVGAGLAICRRMIESYGGKIWAESEPGKGTTFLFTLPKGEMQ